MSSALFIFSFCNLAVAAIIVIIALLGLFINEVRAFWLFFLRVILFIVRVTCRKINVN